LLNIEFAQKSSGQINGCKKKKEILLM
jgi:hypothetical protein